MSNLDREGILKDVYALIAELWCCPSEADANREAIKKSAKDVIQRLETVNGEAATLLSRFLAEEAIAEEDYIELFELNPHCALYIGSHTFDEPETCATAGVSDRNGYMIELVAIYNHFGQKPNGSEPGKGCGERSYAYRQGFHSRQSAYVSSDEL